MNKVESLEKLGLTPSESAVLLFLTQNGLTRAPQIQASLELTKVATYRSLNSLIGKGLVRTTGDRRLQKFMAEPLQKLLAKYDRNIEELHGARAELEQWISELANSENQLYKDRKIQVYEGAEGYRLWLEDRLTGDTKLIREFGTSTYWWDFGRTQAEGKQLVMEYMRKRAHKDIKLKSIFTNNRDLPAHARTWDEYLKESRYLDMPAAPLLCLSMFGSRMGFYSGNDGIYRGVIIDDRFLTGMLSAIFDILWGQSEPL